jgi:hypothetical protein
MTCTVGVFCRLCICAYRHWPAYYYISFLPTGKLFYAPSKTMFGGMSAFLGEFHERIEPYGKAGIDVGILDAVYQ